MTYSVPSRSRTTAQIVEDVKKVLKHLEDAESIITKKALMVQKQIDWVKGVTDKTEDKTEESETIISDLEMRLDIYTDKVDQTQSLAASLAEYFNLQ